MYDDLLRDAQHAIARMTLAQRAFVASRIRDMRLALDRDPASHHEATQRLVDDYHAMRLRRAS